MGRGKSHVSSVLAYKDAEVTALCDINEGAANSVAKMVYGIADTLVTNVFSDAQKNRINTLILPTDQEEKIDITIPFYVKNDLCDCEICLAEKSCPNGAISYAKKVEIDFSKCNSCYICVAKCPKNAIVNEYPATLYSKKIDLKN